MAIKKLQNNYTTPEQSKRLLELGVPADSADVPMIVFKDGTYIYKEILKDKTLSDYQAEDDAFQDEQDYPSYVHYCPSWSVGRLIEIYLLAVERNTLRKITMHDCTLMESVLQNFEEIQECIEEGVFDFSKLEE